MNNNEKKLNRMNRYRVIKENLMGQYHNNIYNDLLNQLAKLKMPNRKQY